MAKKTTETEEPKKEMTEKEKAVQNIIRTLSTLRNLKGKEDAVKEAIEKTEVKALKEYVTTLEYFFNLCKTAYDGQKEAYKAALKNQKEAIDAELADLA